MSPHLDFVCVVHHPTFQLLTGHCVHYHTVLIPANASLFYEVILHEMAHCLGIGTVWDDNNWFSSTCTPGSGAAISYTGANGVAAYATTDCPSFSSTLRIETSTGSGGSDCSHWSESFYNSELMTPVRGTWTVASPSIASCVSPPFCCHNHRLPRHWVPTCPSPSLRSAPWRTFGLQSTTRRPSPSVALPRPWRPRARTRGPTQSYSSPSLESPRTARSFRARDEHLLRVGVDVGSGQSWEEGTAGMVVASFLRVC